MTLRVIDLVPPQYDSNGKQWSLLISPQAAGRSTKTGTFDDSVILDSLHTAEVTVLWSTLIGREPGAPWRSPNERLFHFNQDHYSKMVKKAFGAVGGGVSRSSRLLRAPWRAGVGPIQKVQDSGEGKKQRKVVVGPQPPPLRKAQQARTGHGKDPTEVAKVPCPVRRATRQVSRAPALGSRRALRKLGVFLEIFAGVGGMSKAMRKQGFDTDSIDMLKCPEHDMLVPRKQRRVLIQIRTNRVAGVWLGTPCTSLTRARHGTPASGWPPPLRSAACPDGLSDLSSKDSQKVEEGNKLLEFSARVISLCVRMKIPVAVENPCASFLWWTSPFAALARRQTPHERNFDFCSWRKPWRKRTKIWSWGVTFHTLGKYAAHRKVFVTAPIANMSFFEAQTRKVSFFQKSLNHTQLLCANVSLP